MNYRIACVMDLGPRGNQEDCLLVGGHVHQKNDFAESYEIQAPFVLAACDGMGGHAGGEVASRFICDELKTRFKPSLCEQTVLEKIFKAMQTKSVSQNLPAECGSTMTAMIVNQGKALIANAGDSRVYKIVRKKAVQLSHDHSLVQDLVDKKTISRSDAFTHPYKNIVNFGMGPAFREFWERYQVNFIEEDLAPGNCYLLCSDGVNDVLRDKEIGAALGSKPYENSSKLLQALKDRGLKDNTSFIILECMKS